MRCPLLKKSFLPGPGGHDLVALPAGNPGEQLVQIAVVLDNQQACVRGFHSLHGGTGSSGSAGPLGRPS
jgi:hypothetical protein